MSVHIPKPVMVGLAYVVACVIGWMLYASATAEAHSQDAVLSGTLASVPPPRASVAAPAVDSSLAVPTTSVESASTDLSTNVAKTEAPILTGALNSSPAIAAPATNSEPPYRADSNEPDAALPTTPGIDAPASAVPLVPAVFQSTPDPLDSAAHVAPSMPVGARTEDTVVNEIDRTLAPTAPSSAVQPAVELTTPQPDQVPEVGPLVIRGPGSYIAPILAPLPGAQTRAVAIAEWESYRTDIAGRDIIATTDDSNVFMNRDGKINGNTGDTDASGLNITDARNSIILGTESADFPPWGSPSDPGEGEDEDPEDGDGDGEDTDTGDDLAIGPSSRASASAAFAAVTFIDSESTPSSDFDFPYAEWLQQISGDRASAVHTDEGTTLASGQDAIVIGGDGYDDDDNRAVGEHLILTRDDSNVVIGGSGPVNAQIGDSEQGAVIMDVDNVLIKGGGAY